MAKRLYLASGRNAKFLGVCGGIAEYLDVDPTIVRLAWVILTLLSFGLGILAYFLAFAIIPRR